MKAIQYLLDLRHVQISFFFLSFRNFTTKMWMLKILTVPEIKNVTITSPNLPSKQVPTIDPNFSIFAFCVALTYPSWRTGFLEQI